MRRLYMKDYDGCSSATDEFGFIISCIIYDMRSSPLVHTYSPQLLNSLSSLLIPCVPPERVLVHPLALQPLLRVPFATAVKCASVSEHLRYSRPRLSVALPRWLECCAYRLSLIATARTGQRVELLPPRIRKPRLHLLQFLLSKHALAISKTVGILLCLPEQHTFPCIPPPLSVHRVPSGPNARHASVLRADEGGNGVSAPAVLVPCRVDGVLEHATTRSADILVVPGILARARVDIAHLAVAGMVAEVVVAVTSRGLGVSAMGEGKVEGDVSPSGHSVCHCASSLAGQDGDSVEGRDVDGELPVTPDVRSVPRIAPIGSERKHSRAPTEL